jgi:hypothetical protein
MPVDMRSSSTISTASMGTGRLPLAAMVLLPAAAGRRTSSAKVSQAPHSVQRPIHLADSYPQDWQTKRVFAVFRAMIIFRAYISFLQFINRLIADESGLFIESPLVSTGGDALNSMSIHP